MKKLIISTIVALAACFGATAQEKGDMAVGVDLGIAPCFVKGGGNITNVGIGFKYQYNITDPIRLEADLEYWLKNKQLSVFDVTVNAQYLVGIAEKWNVYPVLGIGIGHISQAGLSWDKFLLNIGIGGEYKLADNLSVGAEFKYQYMQDFGRLPIQIGITYRF